MVEMTAARGNKTVTVVQITDTHLFADRDSELMGYRTYPMLSKTIDAIRGHDFRPDACFLTGDISQDESA
ncbi:metallophosphoesterase, partial [Ralstonia pseudosolanacearum]